MRLTAKDLLNTFRKSLLSKKDKQRMRQIVQRLPPLEDRKRIMPGRPHPGQGHQATSGQALQTSQGSEWNFDLPEDESGTATGEAEINLPTEET